MRTPVIAGNWKMNTSRQEAMELLEGLLPKLEPLVSVERVLCPPFVHLAVLSPRLKGTGVRLGAQDLHWEESGAWTGEISGAMVAEYCQFAIVGHSERRAHFAESDEVVRKKVRAALRSSLKPIVCVGETLDEREAGVASEVVQRQLTRALEGMGAEDLRNVTIAYEPVWAIGTGRSATPEVAQEMAGLVIRQTLAALGTDRIAQDVRILYGGSLSSENAPKFFAEADIDGGLVGGASLRIEEFASIVTAAA